MAAAQPTIFGAEEEPRTTMSCGHRDIAGASPCRKICESPHLSASIRADWEVALGLIQKRMEALVLRVVEAKQPDQRAITAARLVQAEIDQPGEVIARQLATPVHLLHEPPRVLSGDKPLKELG